MATAMLATLLGLAIGVVLCVILAWRKLAALLNSLLDKFNNRGR